VRYPEKKASGAHSTWGITGVKGGAMGIRDGGEMKLRKEKKLANKKKNSAGE